MASYDWIYGRSRSARERGPWSTDARPAAGGRYDEDVRRIDAGPPPRARGREPGWGHHPGEPYIENYGSYGTHPGTSPYPAGPGRRGLPMQGRDAGSGPGDGYGPGAQDARRGYDGGFHPRFAEPSSRHRNPGGRYDLWSRGRGRGD